VVFFLWVVFFGWCFPSESSRALGSCGICFFFAAPAGSAVSGRSSDKYEPEFFMRKESQANRAFSSFPEAVPEVYRRAVNPCLVLGCWARHLTGSVVPHTRADVPRERQPSSSSSPPFITPSPPAQGGRVVACYAADPLTASG